jgi:hypothetical protein
LKSKKCKICGNEFQPRSSLQKVCGWQCAKVLVDQQNAKKQAKERAEGLKKLKTLQDYIKDAQTAVNAYIRERDYEKPCISCRKFHKGQYHAGHYRTTKAAPQLRFNTFNISKQCSICNNWLSGNLLEYRINLVKRYGLEKIEWLENYNESKRYTIEYLERLTRIFRKRTKLLQKRKL